MAFGGGASGAPVGRAPTGLSGIKARCCPLARIFDTHYRGGGATDEDITERQRLEKQRDNMLAQENRNPSPVPMAPRLVAARADIWHGDYRHFLDRLPGASGLPRRSLEAIKGLRFFDLVSAR